jgi:PAS domain S-box-containing protein
MRPFSGKGSAGPRADRAAQNGVIGVDGDVRLQDAVMANIGAGVSLVRASDGEIVYANEEWNRMFGYEQGELLGRHISVVNAATDQAPRERAEEIFEALGDEGVWRGEIHNVRKDGTHFWTACSVSRFDDPNHGTVWVSVNTDITARRAEDDRLRDAELTYRRLFDANPAALALIDSDLRLTLVNQAFADIVGYCRTELEGTLLSDLTHPDDVQLCTELRSRVISGETPRYRIEERFVTRQGDVVPVAFSATVVRGADGVAIAEVATVEKLDARA